MEINTLDNTLIDDLSTVCVKKMNHIFEISYIEHPNKIQNIKLIDKDHYEILSTGEVKVCNHIENRSQSKMQLSQSLKRLRDYINTNVVDINNCKWITLTYAENMTDTKQLYSDFRKFIKKFRYKYGHFEYIVCCEPQGRGAWHCHCIVIFDKKAPFIPNKIISELWGLGFTNTNKLDNCDNIGAYLSAYLGDVELNLCDLSVDELKHYTIKETEVIDKKTGKIIKKKFVKGARLDMYPPNFNLYRTSRGIKPPKKEYYRYSTIKRKIGHISPTYSKGFVLSDSEKNFNNKIIYEYYNTKRV